MEPSPMKAPAITSGPIIVIDDDETMRRACQAALRRAGYEVETYPDGPSGLKRTEEVRPSVLIVDLKMPGMSGMEVIEQLKKMDVDTVVVVITGFATVGTAVDAMKAGAYDFIPKPFTAEELRAIIARAVERYRLSTEAKRLRKEKEAQARSFITFVSHQLQSPLGAVRQYLDVLLHQMGGDVPAQHHQWIDRSSKKITGMLQIIADWLTLSKVEGGQLATERESVRWQELVAEALDGFATSAQEKRVTLQDEVPASLPPVIGDQAALRMLLSNLLANAVTYNRPGGQVKVAAAAEDEAVSLSVIDTGVGIAPAHQPHVFEEFYRVKDGSTAGTSGTGLGLAICKRIAEELGGQITLSSEPGRGSTFTVVLPRDPAHRAAIDLPAAGEPGEDFPIGGA
jgi:two-component system sensor histidine kinase/response regulator